MPQKRPGRAARCGPASRYAGEYERSRSGYRRDGLMARFGQDVALLDVLPQGRSGLLWPSPPTCQFAPTPRRPRADHRLDRTASGPIQRVPDRSLMVCLVEDDRRAGGGQLAREKGAGASAGS